MERMKDFKDYERKSAEVKSDPFVVEESGGKSVMCQLKVPLVNQMAMGYDDEKVKQILLDTLKEHCVEIGYTYQHDRQSKDITFFRNDKREMVLTAILRRNKYTKRLDRAFEKNKVMAPTLKDIFKGS